MIHFLKKEGAFADKTLFLSVGSYTTTSAWDLSRDKRQEVISHVASSATRDQVIASIPRSLEGSNSIQQPRAREA